MLTKTDKQILRFIEDNKSITIYQCYRIFYRHNKYGHDYARKRLRILSDMGLLKQGKNQVTNEMIYYESKQLSPHDLYIYDFYSLLIFHGAKVLEFKKQPRYTLDVRYIEPDAFFKYEFNGTIQGVFVEIDFTHATALPKYEPYHTDYFTKLYGGNPFICIISDNIRKQKSSFDVVYMDTKMTDFVLNILS